MIGDFHLCDRVLSFAGVGVELTGGLGNQMFQYAAGLAVARRTGAPLCLDYRRASGPRGTGMAISALLVPHDLSLERGADDWENLLVRCGKLGLAIAGKRRQRAAPNPVAGVQAWRAKSFAFDPGFRNVEAPVWLAGHFQSERYFDECADTLRHIFLQRRDEVEPVSRKGRSATVAVHVRRGDYLTRQNRLRHPVLGPDYYKRAMMVVREALGDTKFVVFSDDYAFVVEHFSDTDCTLADPGQAAHVDLLRMSTADGHIIANSTYSWWGAWLAQSKVVVAPNRWFGVADLDSADLVPTDWIRV